MVEVPYRYGLRKAGESKTDSDIRVFLKLAITYALRVLQIRMKHGSSFVAKATTAGRPDVIIIFYVNS